MFTIFKGISQSSPLTLLWLALLTGLGACKLDSFWKKSTQKAHCNVPLSPNAHSSHTIRLKLVKGKLAKHAQKERHMLSINAFPAWTCSYHAMTVPAALAVPLAEAALHTSAEDFVSHSQPVSSSPSFCRTPNNEVLFIRSWKAVKSETVFLSLMLALQKINKPWTGTPFETPTSKFNRGNIRSDVVKKNTSYMSTMAAQGYLLAEWIPSEMQPSITLVSPLLIQNTEASCQNSFKL